MSGNSNKSQQAQVVQRTEETTEVAEHVLDPTTRGPQIGFQSDAAREAATAPETVVAGPSKLETLLPSSAPAKSVQRTASVDGNKMVKVKPRYSVPRLRYGKEWYSITAGREVLVPQHFANHLENKGLL